MKAACTAWLLLLVAGCGPRIVGVDTHQAIWTVIAEARLAADSAEFVRADSLLAHATLAHAHEPEVPEALYWRALVQLDPRNIDGSRTLAVRLLDAYLRHGDPPAHGTTARSLLQLMAEVDSLQQTLLDTLVTAEASTDSVQRQRERELERENARLREALERSNAELERIRRRLAAPPQR